MRQFWSVLLVAFLLGCSSSANKGPDEQTTTVNTPMAAPTRAAELPQARPQTGNASGGAIKNAPSRRRAASEPVPADEVVGGGTPDDLPPEVRAQAQGKRIVTVEENGQIIDKTEDGLILRIRPKE